LSFGWWTTPCTTSSIAGHQRPELSTAALAQGMALMRTDSERLVANGTTGREELVRVTRD